MLTKPKILMRKSRDILKSVPNEPRYNPDSRMSGKDHPEIRSKSAWKRLSDICTDLEPHFDTQIELIYTV